MLYHIITWAYRIFFRFFLRFKVEGGEHIPVKGAFILAANHSSSLDPMLLAASMRRTIHFIMRDKLLSFPILGWILKYSKTIPIKRHGDNLAALKKSFRLLKKGEVLGIFPEGTRVKDRKLKKAKPGVGMFVYKAKVPVIPAYIEGAFDAMPRQLKTFKRHPVRVIIGKPMYFKQEYSAAQGKDVYQDIGDKIMKQITGLKVSYRK